MEQKEKGRGIRRLEKKEQVTCIAKIVEEKKEQYREWTQEFRERHGYSA